MHEEQLRYREQQCKDQEANEASVEQKIRAEEVESEKVKKARKEKFLLEIEESSKVT